MYVKITNGTVDQFPYTVGLLRRDNPNTSFPKTIPESTLNSWGVYSVTQQDTPSYSEKTQKVSVSDTPTLVNGEWVLSVSIVDKTDEEIQEYNSYVTEENKAIRNSRLGQTDWWASSDLTMTAEQTAYRQALRDITIHANWPHLEDADWPIEP